MNFSDFTSIFELFCAYNFANAVQESDAKKLLNFNSSISEKVHATSKHINSELQKLLSDQDERSNLEKLNDAFQQKTLVNKIEKKLNIHEIRVSNFYLLGGLFSFVLLILTGISSSFHKLNTYPILFLITLSLFILFLVCDFIQLHKTEKKLCLSFAIILTTAAWFNCVFNVFERKDHFNIIPAILFSSLLLFSLFRKSIIKRKLYKGIFAFAALAFPLWPDSNLWSGSFYGNNQDQAILMLLISAIFIAILPLLYDIIWQNYFDNKIHKIQTTVKQIVVQKEIIEKVGHLNEEAIGPLQNIIQTN